MSKEVKDDTFLARWLSGDLNKEELEKFQKSDDFLAYKDLEKGIAYLREPKFDVEQNFELQKEFNTSYVKKKPKVIRITTWIGSIAAAIVFLLGVKVFLIDVAEIETGIGETQVVYLPDGSEVQLNAMSKLSYNKSLFKNKRKITLEGQAYFKVAKGQKFTVQVSNKGAVSVLGTQFDINERNDYMIVKCFEGKVRVDARGQYILTRGKGVHVYNNETKHIELKEVQPNWIKGVSKFEKALLKDVIDELERYYEISINAENTNIERHFSGSFPHKDLNVALQAVFETLNISYTFVNQNNVILEDR